MEELTAIMSEKEAAVLRVLEAGYRPVGELKDERGITFPPLGAEQREQRIHQIGVVVQIGGKPGLALPAGIESIPIKQVLPQEVGSALSDLEPVGFTQGDTGLGESLNCHRVPGGQYFVIEAWGDSLLTQREQLLLGAR